MKFIQLLLFVFNLWMCISCENEKLSDFGTLSEMVFYSEQLIEMGLGPDGVFFGYQTLQFENDSQFYWYHSDLSDYGTYELISDTELILTFKYMFETDNPTDVFECELQNNKTLIVCEFGNFYTEETHP